MTCQMAESSSARLQRRQVSRRRRHQAPAPLHAFEGDSVVRQALLARDARRESEVGAAMGEAFPGPVELAGRTGHLLPHSALRP